MVNASLLIRFVQTPTRTSTKNN